MANYLSTKTYGNDRGLSCCFRQWRSTHSHCSLIHGYSIGIKLVFESETLDDRNWVMDFGGLKAFKEWSEWQFDHTLVVANDDPHLSFFRQMSHLGDPPVSGTGSIVNVKPHERKALCDLRIVGRGWTHPDGRVFEARYPVGQGVRLRSAEVFEHAGNSAVYEG